MLVADDEMQAGMHPAAPLDGVEEYHDDDDEPPPNPNPHPRPHPNPNQSPNQSPKDAAKLPLETALADSSLVGAACDGDRGREVWPLVQLILHPKVESSARDSVEVTISFV